MIIIDRADCRPVSLREATELLRAVAHPIRLQLLAQLRHGERCVGDLVDAAQLPQPVVSRHLAIMRHAGVVRCERLGREKIYSVAAQPFVNHMIDLLFEGRLPERQPT